ncbi:hypothetical protein GVN21_19050 [Caulobacter sp. SLTY]|uniref:hypothetical protein n=1 Tax=Caulobacter sp. SLTY TaxID=2683262 RepID=UPI00141209F9|nr:hypothetical protein [Caulobacter sp. SLTY]NBB17463.1 hypothetical protein [Caulobacter sp. SLTY]
MSQQEQWVEARLRLEALKLAHRFDRETWQVLAVAEAYAAWLAPPPPNPIAATKAT